MNPSQISPLGSSPTLLENLSTLPVLEALAVLLLAWAVVTWNHRLIESLSKRSVRGRLLVKQFEPIIRMLVWLVAASIALRVLAPSRETFLALIASIGLAVGLGAQDLVRNLIGGIIVVLERPFQAGDRIRIDDAYGEVEHVGLRSTRLVTPDDTTVTIPNGAVMSGLVFNANTGVPDCQVVTDVIVPYGLDPQRALAVGYDAAYSSPFLLLSKPVTVLLMDRFEHHPYCVLRVKAYVYDHRAEPRMQSDITIRVKDALLAAGVVPREGEVYLPTSEHDVVNPPLA